MAKNTAPTTTTEAQEAVVNLRPMLPIDRIVAGKNYSRPLYGEEYESPEAFEKFKANIKKHGIIEPLVVTTGKGGKFDLQAGHRRFKAASELGMKQVPVTLLDLDTASLSKEDASIFENLHRIDPSPIEWGMLFKKMSDGGSSNAQIAKHYDVSPAFVTEHIAIAEKIKSTKNRLMVHNGIMGRKTAALIAAIPEEHQEEVVKRAEKKEEVKQEAKAKTKAKKKVKAGKRTVAPTKEQEAIAKSTRESLKSQKKRLSGASVEEAAAEIAQETGDKRVASALDRKATGKEVNQLVSVLEPVSDLSAGFARLTKLIKDWNKSKVTDDNLVAGIAELLVSEEEGEGEEE